MSYEGYELFWRNRYCFSISTAGREDGTCDVYLCVLGENTHEHVWFQLNCERITNGGFRLKNKGEHISPNKFFECNSTMPFVRASVKWNPENESVDCQIADIAQLSTYKSEPTLA